MRCTNTLLIAVIFLISAPMLHAQWQWSNPAPQGNDLWNVSFAAGTASGWAVGGAGMIVRSTDAGNTWHTLESGREDFLRGVEAVDAVNVWAVGDNGVVLRSSDGGATWQQQSSGTTAGINMIRAVSTSNAAFVGDNGMLHTTTNGGQTWIPRSTGTTFNLNDLFFTDALNGVAVGAGKTIIRTTNGGTSWTPVFLAGMTYDLIGTYFLTSQLGWACGTGGRMLRTTDGGQSWQTSNSSTATDINRVVFVDAQNGWAAGEGGVLLRSTNGGVSWSPASTGTVNGLEGIDVSGTAVIAVGIFGDIIRSTNGSTFGMITSGFRGTVNAVCAAPPSSAWAVGSGGLIMNSTSGGQWWQPQNSGTTEALFAVDNINGSTVVACGNGGLILRSVNGGQSWSSVPSGAGVALNGICLLDNGVGYIVGSSGRILKTTNGGAGWYAVASGTLQSLNAVHFTDANRGTVVGTDGLILGTTNGGYTWSTQQGWTLDALFSVIRDGDNGMICGDGGTAIFTDDGGVTWSSRVVPTNAALFRLAHPAPAEYAAVGADGVIMRTSDNGQSWVREVTHAMYTLYGADADGGVVYTVGDFGMVLRNTTYPFPIELLSFEATAADGCVLLRWETAKEEAHHGTVVQRRDGAAWIDRAYFPSRGSGGASYDWRDCENATENRWYRLKSIGLAGDVTYSPEIEVSDPDASPSRATSLSIDAWPQPALGDVHVHLRGDDETATLSVLDALGREIYRSAVSEYMNSGALVLPARLFATSGPYLLLLRDRTSSIVKDIMVVR